MSELRLAFMGTPRFSLPILAAIEDLGWRIGAVYTAPDRPVGRGQKVAESPVKTHALSRGWTVVTPEKLTADEVERAEKEQFDLVVVAAYGLLLPRRFLAAPRLGCVNIHPSLLPRYRGAAPVAGAILGGDGETGTTLMMMDAGMDTGPILAQEKVELDGRERTGELTERLFALGAEMVRRYLPAFVAGKLTPVPQLDEGVVTTRRIVKADGEIDWAKDATTIDREVRAYDPWPRARSRWKGLALEILSCRILPETLHPAPGTVVAIAKDEVAVSAGEGSLLLERVKLEGKKEVPAAEFVRGHRDFIGSTLPT